MSEHEEVVEKGVSGAEPVAGAADEAVVAVPEAAVEVKKEAVEAPVGVVESGPDKAVEGGVADLGEDDFLGEVAGFADEDAGRLRHRG